MKEESGPTLRLCWLGHPRIELSGGQVRLETRKTTALLAYLSLIEHPQSREKLAMLFWPEFDQSRAPANLRRAIASLHASLPGDWLESERDTLGLSSTSVWIDVLVARRLVEGVKDHPHELDEPCAECLQPLQEAVELFQGEFLEGFNLPDCAEFDDWQTVQRENLRLELGWLLERSAWAHAAAGRWEEALRPARRWLLQDRMHEPAQALLMRILALSGRRSAAIRQYEEYAEALHEEFGQEPEEATRELYNRILSREIGPRAKGPAKKSTGEERAQHRSSSQMRASVGLLGTKLSIPPLREGIVRRGRLMQLLEQGLRRGLILVSAPAGFGKTTILTELAAHSQASIAWLSLDEGDNDPQRFLLHLAGSLGAISEGVAEETAQMLEAMPPPPAQLVMTALINALHERASTVILVLDDYHLVRAPEVHEALRFLIDHRPAPLAILIATRADPPVPLARLRSQGSVTEIRAEDLRFTAPEARQFFDQTMSLPLTPDQVALLERRTEGWAAGLQMAGLSLQGRENVAEFIASFGGTHRYIMDYLAEEVLSRLESELREFLLETSILERMNIGLCEAVTRRGRGEEALRYLEQMNLFLVPLDEERSWYRYHHLFADLLRHKLSRERSPEQVKELHTRAGDWYAAEGNLVEAIREYLAASASEKAADLIEARCYDLISSGALAELQRWCKEISPQAMENRPGLRLAAAWTLAWAGRRQEAESLLDEVEWSIAAAVGDSDGLHLLEGTATTIRAILADMAGETARAVELARSADALLPADDFVPKSVILYILAKSYLYQGELEQAEERLGEFMLACRATGSIWSISAAVCEMVRLRSLQGRPRDAVALIAEFDALAAKRHARGSGPIAKVYSLMAEFKREEGELDEAVRIAETAARNAEAWGQPSDLYYTRQCLARMLRADGQLEAAQAELEKVESLPRKALVFSTVVPSFEADRVKIYLARGDIAAAEAWVHTYRPGKAEGPVNREVELATLARVRLAAGVTEANAGELSELLTGLDRSARTGGRIGPLIAILVLEARFKGSLGAENAALSTLDEALRLAQPAGYFRLFVEEGPQVAALLRCGRSSGMWGSAPLEKYVGRLLSAFDSST